MLLKRTRCIHTLYVYIHICMHLFISSSATAPDRRRAQTLGVVQALGVARCPVRRGNIAQHTIAHPPLPQVCQLLHVVEGCVAGTQHSTVDGYAALKGDQHITHMHASRYIRTCIGIDVIRAPRCVDVYVCMYIYIYIYICVYVYVYASMYMHVYVYLYRIIYTCRYTC